MHILHRGKENPACTLGVCTMYFVRMPQIAFELLLVTAYFPDVYVHTCVCKGEVRSEEGDGPWKAVC